MADDKKKIDLSNLSDDNFDELIGTVDTPDDDLFLDIENDLGDIDMELDIDDANLDIFEDLEDDISLIDQQLEVIGQNNDHTATLAMLMGIDLETSKPSKGLSNDLAKYTLGVDVEEEEETNIDVPVEFTQGELDELKSMVTGILSFHQDLSIREKAKQVEKTLFENNKARNHAELKKREIQESSEGLINEIRTLKFIFTVYDKRESGGKITKDEQEKVIDRYSLKDAQEWYRKKSWELKNLTNQAEQLEQAVATCNKIEKEIFASFNELDLANKAATAKNIGVTVANLFANSKKVIKVQFGGELYSSDFRETKVAVMCACGHKGIHDYSKLPYYVGGDIYGNFKERKFTNSNVQKNYFMAKGRIKQTETKTKLTREEKMVDSRIGIPGITDNHSEPLKCDACKANLFFTPDSIERLAEKGFITDEFIAELSESGFGKSFDMSNGMRLIMHDSNVSKKYLGDLGLAEYKMSKITSNIHSTDGIASGRMNTSLRLDERALREYARSESPTLDLKVVEEEFLNHVANIRLAIKEIKASMKPKKVKSNSTQEQIVKIEIHNERRERLIEFLVSHEGLIIKYAIDNKMSAVNLKNLITNNLNNLSDIKNTLYEFLVDYMLDAVINRKATFIFEEGSARTINNKEIVLPHTNFFDCYREPIREFLLGQVRNIKKNVDLIKYYNLFRELSNIGRIVGNDKLKVEKSEEFVKDFRQVLGSYYETAKKPAFLNYVGDNSKLESNFDLDGKCFAWLYYEMLTQDRILNNTEVQDTELFSNLYGKELEEQGNFYYFQLNK